MRIALAPSVAWMVCLFVLSCAKKPNLHEEAASVLYPSQDAPTFNPDEVILELHDDAPLSPIFFEYDSHAISELHKLHALVDYLKFHPQPVLLQGHASPEGTGEYNIDLAMARTVKVRAYLKAAGIEDVSVISYGEEKPITWDQDKMHLNRRVEIVLQGESK